MLKKNAPKAVLCILAAQPFTLKNSVNTNAIGLANILGYGALALSLGKKALSLLDTFATKGQGYMYSLWFLRDMKDKVVDFYDWLSHYINKTTFRKPDEVKKNLEEGFKKIKGQEKAKEAVMNFALDLSHDKHRAEINKEKRTGADIILFTGTSGCGKSMMAEELAKSISTAPAFVISSGDIDINNKTTIVSQLFGERNSYDSYEGRYQKPSEKNCLISYISRVKHGVVIINEYDKMHAKPSKDEKDDSALDPLDEVLRSFADTGTAYVCGKKIDASNITFILTSNEKMTEEKTNKVAKNTENSSSSVIKKEEDKISDSDKKSSVTAKKAETAKEANAEKIKGATKEEQQDINKNNKDGDIEVNKKEDLSRTNVKRDKSFFNRVAKVEFERLAQEDLEGIVKDQYGKTMIEYWKNYANIELDLSKIYKQVAKKASTMEEHGRSVKIIMRKLTGLLSKVYKKKESKVNEKVKKVLVNYDAEKDSFSLEELKK